MESRSFIRHARITIAKIKDVADKFDCDSVAAERAEIQKEINQLFAGLANPTLPSAVDLCIAALHAGFSVRPEMQNRLHQAEGLWG